MFKLVLGVVIGTLFADTIKVWAKKAWDWLKNLEFWDNIKGD